MAVQFCQTAFQEAALRSLPGEFERTLVGRHSFREATESATQISTRGVREIIFAQVAARKEGVDQRDSRRRAVAHSDGRGPVELHHGRIFDAQQHVVKSHDLPPVGRRGGCGFGVDGGDCGLQRVRPKSSRSQGPFHQCGPLANLFVIPQGAVLLVEQQQFAIGGSPRGTPGIVQQHQAQQPDGFRFGQQFRQQAPEADGLGGKIGARQRFAGGRRIAFVENEIEHVQHGVEALRQLLARGHLIWDVRLGDFAFGAHDALRQRRRRHQKCACDFLRGQAADFAQRQGDTRVRRQRRMAASKNQAQPVIFEAVLRVQVITRVRRFPAFQMIGEGGQRGVKACPAAQPVDGFEASRGNEPGARILRHAIARPAFERRHERVMQGFFRQLEAAKQANQRGQHAARFGTIERVNLVEASAACRSDTSAARRSDPWVGFGRHAGSNPGAEFDALHRPVPRLI